MNPILIDHAIVQVIEVAQGPLSDALETLKRWDNKQKDAFILSFCILMQQAMTEENKGLLILDVEGLAANYSADVEKQIDYKRNAHELIKELKKEAKEYENE